MISIMIRIIALLCLFTLLFLLHLLGLWLLLDCFYYYFLHPQQTLLLPALLLLFTNIILVYYVLTHLFRLLLPPFFGNPALPCQDTLRVGVEEGDQLADGL